MSGRDAECLGFLWEALGTTWLMLLTALMAVAGEE